MQEHCRLYVQYSLLVVHIPVSRIAAAGEPQLSSHGCLVGARWKMECAKHGAHPTTYEAENNTGPLSSVRYPWAQTPEKGST